MTPESSRLCAITNSDGAAILNTSAGQITTLNPTGARVWQALERGETLEEIAASLAKETGEELETLKRDVSNFIESLRAQRVLPR